MARRFDAVAAGHICLDIFPTFKSRGPDLAGILIPGKLVDIGEAHLSPGGPVHNTGVNLKKLGLRTALMGKAGDDHFGKILLALLADRGGTEGMRIVKGEQTSYSVVLAPPGVDRVFLHNPGANDTYSSKDIDYRTVADSRLFHFGYPPLMKRMFRDEGRELSAIFRKAKSLGAVTSLDLALPDPDSEAGRADWRKILKSTLPFVDIFLPSVEELMFMLDRKKFDRIRKKAAGQDAVEFYERQDIRGLADELLGMGARIAVLKAGKKGAYLRTAGAEQVRKIPEMTGKRTRDWAGLELWGRPFRAKKFVSSTGAGDSFIAGFLTAYLHGYTAAEALRAANCVASQNVTAMDATSGVKSWTETVKFLSFRLMDNVAELPQLNDE
jgi:sugar/nucleoside kinase (ribokinase family)